MHEILIISPIHIFPQINHQFIPFQKVRNRLISRYNMGPKGFLPLGFVFSKASKSLKNPTSYLYNDTNKKILEQRQLLYTKNY
jgi:hypothetical protein